MSAEERIKLIQEHPALNLIKGLVEDEVLHVYTTQQLVDLLNLIKAEEVVTTP